jgi:hypothetical protein
MVTQNDLIGSLEGFPIEVVEKMLYNQQLQGNPKDILIFQRHNTIDKHGGGFDWEMTIEGDNFWLNVINNKNFNLFFEKYPIKIQEYPKVMMVWNINRLDAFPRVVQFFMKNRYFAWACAENEEDAENIDILLSWKYAEDPLTFNKNN